jgi:hypothetical protein
MRGLHRIQALGEGISSAMSLKLVETEILIWLSKFQRQGINPMTRLLKFVPACLLAVCAFAQSDGAAKNPSNMTVVTPGGAASYVSLFSNKNTIVKSGIVQKGGNVGIIMRTPLDGQSK